MSTRTGRRATIRKTAGAAPSATSPSAFVLPATLDRNQAPALAEAFLAARGGDIAVDASTVTHFGAQCAQVLLSARKTWSAEGHSFSIARHSDAFTEGARLLGLATYLGE